MHRFRFVVAPVPIVFSGWWDVDTGKSLFTFCNIFCGNASLGQIDVALFLINTQYHHHFISIYANQLVDTSDPPPTQLTQQDHALDVVIFQQGHVGSHLRDVPHINHHQRFQLRKGLLIEPAFKSLRVAKRCHVQRYPAPTTCMQAQASTFPGAPVHWEAIPKDKNNHRARAPHRSIYLLFVAAGRSMS